jgi:hypothetical protein
VPNAAGRECGRDHDGRTRCRAPGRVPACIRPRVSMAGGRSHRRSLRPVEAMLTPTVVLPPRFLPRAPAEALALAPACSWSGAWRANTVATFSTVAVYRRSKGGRL